MPKTKTAKITRDEKGNYSYFPQSNFWWIEQFENPAEVIDGTVLKSRMVFTANDGRRFQVRQDYTAIEVN